MFRKYLSLLVALIMVAPVRGQNLASNQTNDQLDAIDVVVKKFNRPANTESIEGTFDYSGKLNLSKWSGSEFDRSLKFFKSEELQNEIEIVGSQKKSYLRAIKEWEKELANSIKKFERAVETGNREHALRVFAKLEETNRTSEQNLRDALLEHQYLWMKQIQIRYLARVHGLKRIIQIEEVRNYADISNVELSQFMATSKECRKMLEDRVEQTMKSSIKTIFGDFSKGQVLTISKRFPKYQAGTIQNAERLRAHINMVEVFESKEQVDSIYEEMVKFPELRLAISGGLEPRFLETKFFDGEDNLIKAELLQTVLSSPDSGVRLSITDGQSRRCNEVFKSMKEKYRQLSIEELTVTSNSVSEVNAAKIRRRELQYSIAKETIERIKAIVGVEIVSGLDNIAKEVLDRRWGPFVDMLHGKLGQMLKLSKREKEMLRSKIADAVEELEANSVEFEAAIIEKQLDSLDSESKKKIESLLGPELKNSSPSIIGLRLGL